MTLHTAVLSVLSREITALIEAVHYQKLKKTNLGSMSARASLKARMPKRASDGELTPALLFIDVWQWLFGGRHVFTSVGRAMLKSVADISLG